MPSLDNIIYVSEVIKMNNPNEQVKMTPAETINSVSGIATQMAILQANYLRQDTKASHAQLALIESQLELILDNGDTAVLSSVSRDLQDCYNNVCDAVKKYDQEIKTLC